MKKEEALKKGIAALSIILVVAFMIFLGLNSFKGKLERVYRSGYQNGQIEVLNHLSRNGYSTYEVGEDGCLYFTELGKKHLQVVSEMIDSIETLP